MDIQESIAGLAMNMKSVDLSAKVNTKLMEKAMDITKQSSMGIINMMDDVPTFSGETGHLFDARA